MRNATRLVALLTLAAVGACSSSPRWISDDARGQECRSLPSARTAQNLLGEAVKTLKLTGGRMYSVDSVDVGGWAVGPYLDSRPPADSPTVGCQYDFFVTMGYGGPRLVGRLRVTCRKDGPCDSGVFQDMAE